MIVRLPLFRPVTLRREAMRFLSAKKRRRKVDEADRVADPRRYAPLHRSKAPKGEPASFVELRQLLLHSLEGQPYSAYQDLELFEWRHDTHLFTMQFGKTQADPFAPPTRCRLTVPRDKCQFPAALWDSRIRRVAAADFLWRGAHRFVQSRGLDQNIAVALGKKKDGWFGPKGGNVQFMAPTQHVIEQSAVQFDTQGNLICQLTVNLPARGRSILGAEAFQIFDTAFLYMVQQCFIASSSSLKAIQKHVDTMDDQAWLQAQLDDAGLVAFIADGAILPRRSGVDDRPMHAAKLVPFSSPPSLRVSFTLPRTGRVVTGLGIRKGITLLCGGGYHGKSTLLEAIQAGVYLKIPGDGREFCVTSRNAVKIRAEDGRWVSSVDISSFMNQVPLGKDTTCFSTNDASGSTSQASNIVEAIELGADVLLMDEDTCATNFMIRDSKMMELVAGDKEPITPFVRVVTSLKEQGISTIMVIGGTGDFFSVADRVLVMDQYHCTDATSRARAIAGSEEAATAAAPATFGPIRSRTLQSSRLSPNGKVKVQTGNIISYGSTEMNLSRTEQIVSPWQTEAIASAVKYLSLKNVTSSLKAHLDALERHLDAEGLEILEPGRYHGALMRPRSMEVGAALNRLRRNLCLNCE